MYIKRAGAIYDCTVSQVHLVKLVMPNLRFNYMLKLTHSVHDSHKYAMYMLCHRY